MLIPPSNILCDFCQKIRHELLCLPQEFGFMTPANRKKEGRGVKHAPPKFVVNSIQFDETKYE
jgi:hypothetical protein